MAKEMLIRAHAYIFVFFLVVSLAGHITTYAAYLEKQSEKQQEDYVKECRYSVTRDSFWIISNIANTVILFLFTFMSIKFSKRPRAMTG